MPLMDERELDTSGNVIGGYLTPDEARERGLEWKPRPNEPAPYRTEDEIAGKAKPYDYRGDAEPKAFKSHDVYDATVGNYDYGWFDRALASGLFPRAGSPTAGTPGAPVAPAPPAPAQPQNRTGPNGEHLSPYEVAAAENRLPQFDALVKALYKPDGTMAAGWEQVNLYDPSTYAHILGGGTPAPAPTPAPTPAPSGHSTHTATIPVPQQGTAGPFPSGTFDNRPSDFVEGYARDRFTQRTTPAQGSGAARYESWAKEFSSLLQGDVFSDQEEAAMRARMFDQLEQQKQREKEAKRVELSARRITDKSGVFISEMNRIEDKYDKLRASNENELLVTAIGERQRRMTQSLTVLASLAASEEGRMDAALALAMIPLQLQDQAFQRLVTASGMGGDLSGITGSLMQLLTMATNTRLYNEGQQSAALGALGEYFGSYWG